MVNEGVSEAFSVHLNTDLAVKVERLLIVARLRLCETLPVRDIGFLGVGFADFGDVFGEIFGENRIV